MTRLLISIELSILVLVLDVVVSTHQHQLYIPSAAQDDDGDSYQVTSCNSNPFGFYCEADNKCIKQIKVCNFINDCSDGQDELACGSCNFGGAGGLDPSRCGLSLETDNLSFEWRLSEMLPDVSSRLAELSFYGSHRRPTGSIRLEPTEQVLHLVQSPSVQYNENLRLLAAIHKAKIVFPALRPTDNDNCRLSIWLHSRANLHVNQNSRIMSQADEPTAERVASDQVQYPRVSVILVEPDEEKKVNSLTVLLENVYGHMNDWIYLEPHIGSRLGSFWSIVILIETKYNSNLLSLGDFNFMFCEPKDVHRLELEKPHAVSTLIASNQCNSSEEFQCKLSGKCISRDNLCDFGRDCGQYDDSDEFDCPPAYEGRCDFEEADECGWTVPANNLWLLAGVNKYNADIPFKPPLDHTYQSERIGGHFMVLDVKRLTAFDVADLIGPLVQLKDTADKCNFRFWLYAPARLRADRSISAPFLSVGHEQIYLHELFSLNDDQSGSGPGLGPGPGQVKHKQESGWLRFEVRLFDKSIIGQQEFISALHVSFGHLANDLEKFAMHDGYVALDDFSFSEGCQLLFYNRDSLPVCSNDQFQCAQPVPDTSPPAHCIPKNRVCDFKDDCGLDSISKLASDELGCKRECNLNDDNDNQCGLSEIKDAHMDNLLDMYNITFNEAIEFELGQSGAESGKASPIVFKSNGETFLANRESSTKRIHVFSAQARLPTFSQAHANCNLELEYEWSSDAHRLGANIFLTSELNLRRRLYKSLASDRALVASAGSGAQSSRGRKRLKFGLGEQDRKFSVHVEVELVERTANDYSGSFTLHWFKFTDCAYEPGSLDKSQQASVLEAGQDDNDEDYDGFDFDYDEDDAFTGRKSSGSAQTSEQRATGSTSVVSCGPNQFQCGQPVLCLAESLVCDMQRDCQEGGSDESDCEARGFVQFDFERPAAIVDSGWLLAQSTWATWTVQTVDITSRRLYNCGPPVDHTKRSNEGKHLALVVPSDRAQLQSETSAAVAAEPVLAHLPKFKLHNLCTRLVFYVYNWQADDDDDADKGDKSSIDFKAMVKYVSGGGGQEVSVQTKLLHELSPIEPALDRWQRVEIELALEQAVGGNANGDFRIAFYAKSRLGDQFAGPIRFAIDDVSLGPKCELSQSSASDRLLLFTSSEADLLVSGRRADEHNDKHSLGWSVVLVTFFTLSILILMAVLYRQQQQGSNTENYSRASGWFALSQSK